MDSGVSSTPSEVRDGAELGIGFPVVVNHRVQATGPGTGTIAWLVTGTKWNPVPQARTLIPDPTR
jgi:hypothetical protein